jgi:hypothetical protein
MVALLREKIERLCLVRKVNPNGDGTPLEAERATARCALGVQLPHLPLTNDER